MYRAQKQLSEIPIPERVTILYEYLVLGRSMDEISSDYYDNINWSISTVCQGYAEKRGRNRGKVNATRDQVLKFVQTYPKGTYDLGITLSDFIGQYHYQQNLNYNHSFHHRSSPSFNSKKGSKQRVNQGGGANDRASEILGAIIFGAMVWFVVGKWLGYPIIAIILIALSIYGLINDV